MYKESKKNVEQETEKYERDKKKPDRFLEKTFSYSKKEALKKLIVLKGTNDRTRYVSSQNICCFFFWFFSFCFFFFCRFFDRTRLADVDTSKLLLVVHDT